MSIERSVAQATSGSNGRGQPAEGPEAVLGALKAGEIDTVIVGGSDLDGIFRAKRIPAERFLASEQPKVEFSEYIIVMDIEEVALPEPKGYPHRWPDWGTGFGDIVLRVDMETLRRVPWLERTALALGNYYYESGEQIEVAPRNVLCRVIDRIEAIGLKPRFATEFEFHVFRETEPTAMTKGIDGIEALASRPMAYGAIQSSLDDRVIGPIVKHLKGLRVPVEAWAPEGGRGQYELNLYHAAALEAADQGFLFKHSVKELCAMQDMTATFMPKIFGDGFGSSLHVHQSLWREDGSSAFFDANCEDRMSPTMRQFVAGQLQTLSELTVMMLPTPTAYKRLVPYSAVGTTESWGWDNKSLSLRALTHGASGCRVEHRVPGADASPYIVLAAMLAGGLHGIENELELSPPTIGDAYSDPGLKQLPGSLHEAVSLFEGSSVARTYLGEEFVDFYAAKRRWEADQMAKAVTDWEFRRYFSRA
ncbi:MAG TPA: glutamine synthetase family protein [Solirubrobacterales bacterium]|nr:glutamine synthetase family protein [Solirubrobacterales bacterium]